jgi:hypothetical protein
MNQSSLSWIPRRCDMLDAPRRTPDPRLFVRARLRVAAPHCEPRPIRLCSQQPSPAPRRSCPGTVADGGGLAPAVRRPIQGEQRVAGLLIGLRSVDFEIAAVWLNGSPAARIDVSGQFTAAVRLAVRMVGSPTSTPYVSMIVLIG